MGCTTRLRRAREAVVRRAHLFAVAKCETCVPPSAPAPTRRRNTTLALHVWRKVGRERLEFAEQRAELDAGRVQQNGRDRLCCAGVRDDLWRRGPVRDHASIEGGAERKVNPIRCR